MSAETDLEGPGTAEELYQARGDDAELLRHRPLFTGDVLRLGDDHVVALVQHPCSMRHGPVLAPRLLAATVHSWTKGVPSDWTKHPRRMFLLNFDESGNHAIEFDEMEVLVAAEAEQALRLAILSQRGVNLLMQRWAHHLTRLVVPTSRLNDVVSGPFDEADLFGEALDDLVEAKMDDAPARELVEAWFGHGKRGSTRRDLLVDPQERGGLRRELRAQVRDWIQAIE